MEGKKDDHQRIFTTILENQNNNVPKFLDDVVEFIQNKTKYRGRRMIKELFSESVERHFHKKFAAQIKLLSTNDSSENIADQDEWIADLDEYESESKIARGAVEKLSDKPKFKFIDPKNSKFWKKNI